MGILDLPSAHCSKVHWQFYPDQMEELIFERWNVTSRRWGGELRCLTGRLQREEGKAERNNHKDRKNTIFSTTGFGSLLNFRYHPMDTHFGLNNNQIPHIRLQYLTNVVWVQHYSTIYYSLNSTALSMHYSAFKRKNLKNKTPKHFKQSPAFCPISFSFCKWSFLPALWKFCFTFVRSVVKSW